MESWSGMMASGSFVRVCVSASLCVAVSTVGAEKLGAGVSAQVPNGWKELPSSAKRPYRVAAFSYEGCVIYVDRQACGNAADCNELLFSDPSTLLAHTAEYAGETGAFDEILVNKGQSPDCGEAKPVG